MAEYFELHYRKDGQDPATGLDCWGFARHVYRDRGLELPEDVIAAADLFQDAAPPWRDGDLVVFSTHRGPHVGIVIEDHGLKLLLHMTPRGVVAPPLTREHMTIEGVHRPCRT